MKIKQKEFVDAYKTLENISKDLCIPSNIALLFFKVKKLCKEQYEFQVEEQLKILQSFDAKRTENSGWFIEDANKRIECLKKLNELDCMEVNIDYTPKTIHLDGSFNLSIQDIESLSCFFNFE